MRQRSYLLILIISLMILMILSEASASITLVRHIDPSTAREEISLDTLLNMLSLYNEYIMRREYSSAGEVLKTFNESYLPTSLRDVLNRVRDALNRLYDVFNTTDTLFKNAERYLNESSIDNLNKTLNNIYDQLNIARLYIIQFSDLVDTVYRYNSMIGEGLRNTLSAINQTYNNYLTEYNDLKKRLDEMTSAGLIDTMITIDVHPRNVRAGENITIQGFLKDFYGKPLENKTVIIYIGNMTFTSKTDSKGFYNTSLKVSIYQEQAEVYAEYVPSSDDLYRYRYSRSDLVIINISYIKPLLKVRVNTSEAVPGGAFTLYVESNLSIYIEVRSGVVNITKLFVNKSIELSVEIPVNISEGVYRITVYSYPDIGLAPVRAEVNITVYRSDVDFVIKSPSYVLAGFPAEIMIIPSVNSSLIINAPQNVFIEHLGEGFYRLRTSFMYPGSEIDLLVMAVPSDPGHRITYTRVVIPVYNVFASSLLVIFFGSVLYIGYTRVKREISLNLRKSTEKPVVERSFVKPSYATEEFSLISQLINMLEKISSTIFERSMTYREYLDKIRDRVSSSLYEFVEKIFRRIEEYIYGGERYRNVLDEINRLIKDFLRKISS
ncbi:MAG: hypothetical protein JHC19_06490 [Desulfurococcaceae archaeon]|nr:hypothetical protein [Desulfurococcaceae archaeon]